MTDYQESASKKLDDKKGRDLLPCPFCGKVPDLGINPHDNLPFKSPSCDDCFITMESIEQWNTRAPSPQLTATQQALDSAVEALEIVLYSGCLDSVVPISIRGKVEAALAGIKE